MGTGRLQCRDGLCGMLGGTSAASPKFPAPGWARQEPPVPLLEVLLSPGHWWHLLVPAGGRGQSLRDLKRSQRFSSINSQPGCIHSRPAQSAGSCAASPRSDLAPKWKFYTGKEEPSSRQVSAGSPARLQEYPRVLPAHGTGFQLAAPPPLPSRRIAHGSGERHKGHRAVGMALPGHHGTAHQVPAWMEFIILVFPSPTPLLPHPGSTRWDLGSICCYFSSP